MDPQPPHLQPRTIALHANSIKLLSHKRLAESGELRVVPGLRRVHKQALGGRFLGRGLCGQWKRIGIVIEHLGGIVKEGGWLERVHRRARGGPRGGVWRGGRGRADVRGVRGQVGGGGG